MIRVALETSTALGTVAVARDFDLLAEVSLGVQTRHAEKVVPALDYALAVAGVDRSAIGEVVVGGGPGSFTGVRVAAATAKGLVAALGVPLRSFSGLLALATGVAADPERAVCALLDARRQEVYAGCWRVATDRIETVLEPMVGPLDDVVAALAPHDAVFAGDGAHRYRDVLAAATRDTGAAAAPVMAAPAYPRASSLLWLAARDPAAGVVADVAAWEPSYIRASSAERGVRG